MFTRGSLALAAAAILVAAPALTHAHMYQHEGRTDVIRMNEINDLQIRCDQLMSQFDAAVKGRPSTAAIDEAKKLRADAGKDCLAPMDTDVAQSGVDKVTQALNKIGVTPANG